MPHYTIYVLKAPATEYIFVYAWKRTIQFLASRSLLDVDDASQTSNLQVAHELKICNNSQLNYKFRSNVCIMNLCNELDKQLGIGF